MQLLKSIFSRFLRLIRIVLVVGIVCLVCFGVYRYFTYDIQILGVPQSESLVLPFYDSNNPTNHDPHRIGTASAEINMLFSGLVSLDDNSQVIPDIASRWDVSEDGTVYTFHLRDNVKFHDGKSVTASDVKYSFERAASPKLGSTTAPTYLGDIRGFAEYNSGEVGSLSGVRIIDPLTVEITIDAAKPYFLYKLTYPTSYILDATNVNQGDNWFLKPNGTGPYQLDSWEPGSYKFFRVNTDFYLPAAQIPNVILWMSDQSSQDLYEQNAIDVTSTWDIDRFMREDEPLHSELVTNQRMCTNFIVFDTTQPPFDDVHVRRAISMATNRDIFIEKIYRGRALPNTGVFPQGLPGFNENLKALPFDVSQAQAELKLSKYKSFEDLYFTNSGFADNVSRELGLFADMWRQGVGIKFTVQNLESDYYYDKVKSGFHGQMFDGGWCADYPDPENFADALFHTGSAQNESKYSNPKVDALLDAARTEQDVQKRIAQYQEAEQLIVNDAPVLFTATGTSYFLVKPYLKGYTFGASGDFHRDMRFEGKKWYLYKAALAWDYKYVTYWLSSLFEN